MQNPTEQARHLADLEAAFVSEMLGLESLTLVAIKAERPRDLEPHVQSWIADWSSYHARNGHAPLIKSALSVALDRLSTGRIAAAVWTFHHAHQAAPIPRENENLAAHGSAASSGAVKEPARSSMVDNLTNSANCRVVLPAAGSRYGTCDATIDGKPVTLPGTVAHALREIAVGSKEIRLRIETWRKLEADLPWLAELLTRDELKKADARRSLYYVDARAKALIALRNV